MSPGEPPRVTAPSVRRLSAKEAAALPGVSTGNDAPTARKDEERGSKTRAPGTAAALRVVGIHIHTSVAYFAVVEPPDRVRLDLVGQLEPRGPLGRVEHMAHFAEEAHAKLVELGAMTITVAGPLRYSNWQYGEAFPRAALETCLMLEAHRLGIHYQAIGIEHAANVLGLPLHKLDDTLAARLRIEKSSWRHEHFQALLVALAVAAQIPPRAGRRSGTAGSHDRSMPTPVRSSGRDAR